MDTFVYNDLTSKLAITLFSMFVSYPNQCVLRLWCLDMKLGVL